MSAGFIDSCHSDALADMSSAVRQVFDHWVFMLGRDPRRCALGPSRRQVIERALRLYPDSRIGVELCVLAVDGCAASAWHAGANQHGRTYQDLETILADERRIERLAAQGERVRAACEAQARRAQRCLKPRRLAGPPVVARSPA